ncbi:MAG: aminotransferase class I/II-fold pyridoxal phosphate-dependent enzyme, partial [Woeseiaceae bacterium]|nr:aminotransferase class I/II-fold pyridoxal phosphate-dependent enzyme [Woeseiaceae bacterium]
MSGMTVPFLDLKRGFETHADALRAALAEVAASGHYILGPRVAALEEAAQRYLDCENVLTCASGTDALHLAIRAAGIGPGDEVITTPFTFAATVEAIEYVGATAVLVDIDPHSFNIDPGKAAEAVTDQTRGIIPVHLFGLPADMDAIMAIAAERDLVVVEDAAQSLGGKWRNRQTGSIGSFGAFSFYPSKTLGCFGDGGMVAFHDEAQLARMIELRNHG